MSKQLINRKSIQVRLYDFEGSTIKEAIETIKSYNLEGYICKFETYEHYSDGIELYAIYFSEETDEEYRTRLEREELDNLRLKKEQEKQRKKKEDRERKMYLQLKEKYGKEE